MKSQIWICILCIEIALALYFGIGAAMSYGLAASLTCLESRSRPMTQPCAVPSVRPMPRTSGLKPVSTAVKTTISCRCRKIMLTATEKTNLSGTSWMNSTAKEGWATWYSRASARREGTGGKSILMANGKPLNDQAMTCAMWVIGTHGRPLRPDGRFMRIVNTTSGCHIFALWTDNGPGRVPRSRGVVVDLTPAAMMALAGPAGIKAGRVMVRVEKI